ncbi:hypothetical protein [Hahella ganghwensis]|uniref:hypothetical protein n=1 Tax=Hahella ganghwensis TaxID=286420 RepID=UPI00037F0E3E|nr:hypothetical protein [Hahella ganghwensis]
MRWLQRFKASKMNPMRPDIEKAPWMSFDLSGTQLRFRCPPHEVIGPMKLGPQSVPIYQDDVFKPWMNSEGRGMFIRLLFTGWNFWDKPFGEGAIGDVSLDIVLTKRHPHYRKIDSLLKQADMKAWLLSRCDSFWGGANRDKWESREIKVMPVIPEQHFWRYPQSPDDIQQVEVNGTQWYSYIADRPNGPKQRLWHVAISDDHELELDFRPGATNRLYYEPDHDLDGAVEKSIKEFMSHVHLKLSPDAQKRYDEVKAEEAVATPRTSA